MAENSRPIYAQIVQHSADVVHPFFERRHTLCPDPVGESDSPPIEDDDAGKGREPAEKPCQGRLLPVQVELRHPTWHPHEVRPRAERLIGDLKLAARRVVGLRWAVHASTRK